MSKELLEKLDNRIEIRGLSFWHRTFLAELLPVLFEGTPIKCLISKDGELVLYRVDGGLS